MPAFFMKILYMRPARWASGLSECIFLLPEGIALKHDAQGWMVFHGGIFL